MDFFKLTYNSVIVSYSYCNLSHMDGRLYHCFCVILIDCIDFLMRLPTFAQGIMVFWSSCLF